MYPLFDHVHRTEPAAVRSEQPDVRALHARIAAEFREMPGMRLTLSQAARLFSINAARCEHVLGTLVEDGVLATDGRASGRADAGARFERLSLPR